MRLVISKDQIDHLTDTGVWIKLPNGSEMFWLSNKCFYPRKDTASIYLKEEYIYLVRKRTKTAVSFEDYGDRIIDLLRAGSDKLLSNQELHIRKFMPIHHVPEKIKAEKTEAESDLLR